MDITFDSQEQEVPVQPTEKTLLNELTQPVEETTSFSTPSPSNESIETPIAGLSTIEFNDPNQISVTLSNQSIPIIILFGSAACGKTMTLVRLTRYLHNQSYIVRPVRSFRPSTDNNYKKMCDNFPQMINSTSAANSTSLMSFMLVDVMDQQGNPLCQILEAPGEYYFSKENPSKAFPAYVRRIINSNNRKIWNFMLEPDWADETDRLNYVQRIAGLKREMMPKDRIIFILNKIDLTPYVYSVGQVNIKQARKSMEDAFRGIFSPFQHRGVFGTTDKFQFVPFQTGDYSDYDGGTQFTPSHDNYPKMLWEANLKYIKG